MRHFFSLVLALCSLSVLAQTPVALQLRPPFDMDDELRSTWRLLVTNRTNELIDGGFYVSVTEAKVIQVPPESCSTDSSGGARCVFVLPAKATRELHFTMRNNSRNAYVQVVADAFDLSEVAYDVASFGPEYLVTTTADSGPGSLRQGILDLNARNDAPRILRFAIDGPVPQEGWFTIALQSPLPAIEKFAFINAGAQSLHTGETNPFGGPEVLLDGRAAGVGNGLTLLAGGRVIDLAIGGFRGDGIVTTDALFYRNHIGVDPTGLEALPNEGRGVIVIGGSGYLVDNVISGNGRAGGFFWTSGPVRVIRNFIGVGADGVTPLGNGASGVFFHKPEVSYWSGYVSDNVIGYNGHAGIGLSVLATGNYARNTFRDNGAGAIDVGLDGPTPTVAGIPGFGGVIGPPSIATARFENGVTIVTGRIAPKAGGTTSAGDSVAIYAGDGDLQEIVASARVANVDFEVRIPRDLRGLAVRAATVAGYLYNPQDASAGTSELSEPRLVE